MSSASRSEKESRYLWIKAFYWAPERVWSWWRNLPAPTGNTQIHVGLLVSVQYTTEVSEQLSPGRNLKVGSPRYEAEVLTTGPSTCLVMSRLFRDVTVLSVDAKTIFYVTFW